LDEAVRQSNITCFYQAYVDDLILVSDRYEELVESFTRIEAIFREYNLEVNIAKSEYLTNDDSKREMKGIKASATVKYLGV